MLLLVRRDQDVVLVLPLLSRTVLERCHAVAIFPEQGTVRGVSFEKISKPVVEPLPLVLETIRTFTDSEAASFVVLPLAHVRLGHVGVQHLVLHHEAGLAPLGHDGGARVVRLARHPRRGGAR